MSDQFEQPAEPQPSMPPPGWYPDPQGVTRWWDGTAWGQAAPASAAQPGGLAPQPVVAAVQDERSSAALAHWLGLIGVLFIGFGWVGPLVVYMNAKPGEAFVKHHAAEELNFQITLVIGYVVSIVLAFVCIGFFTLAAVWVLNLVFPIIAATKANNGEWYRYPLNIRMVSGAVG